MKNFKIVKINYKYCDYLRNFDYRVYYNSGSKELRPFIGVLFQVEDYMYFAPLSSPKLKHKSMKNTLDFVKIDNGKLGVLNFNNMIPVMKENYDLIDLNKKAVNESELKYQNLLKSQLKWLNRNNEFVRNHAINLYQKYKFNRLPQNVINRCCNFCLLEEKCKDYNNMY